jgi:hypothetical protein
MSHYPEVSKSKSFMWQPYHALNRHRKIQIRAHLQVNVGGMAKLYFPDHKIPAHGNWKLEIIFKVNLSAVV